jgi:hypothetical protein
MTRLLMSSLLLIAACGGKTAPSPPPTSGSAPVLAKKVVLSWGITPKGEISEVYLTTTDETGKAVSHGLGGYKGTCTPFTPPKEMNAITGVTCVTGGGGTDLHAMVQGGEEIVVLKLGTNPGETPDPMGRVEVTRIKIPLGIAVEAAAP